MLTDDEFGADHVDDDQQAADECAGVSTDPEEWQDYHSEELVTLWHLLKDEVASMGVYVLDQCHISDFTEFCFKHSSGRQPPC